MPLVVAFAHSRAACSPKNGRPANQCGGGGRWNFANNPAQPTMRSKCSVIVAIASQNGSTKISNNARVITATASPRLFHSCRCTRSMIGQVATTSVVAQIKAGRNGHRIQNEVAISPATERTARVVRVSSNWFSILRTARRRLALAGVRSLTHHQLQTMPVGVTKVNATVLARTAAHDDPIPLQFVLQGLVVSRRDIQRQMVEVVSRSQ